MNILLTNHHLISNTGTEIYTLTLARYLINAGHHVTIYSNYIDKTPSDLNITNDLSTIVSHNFDIAHVHHNINAIEIRHHFPTLPIILQVHGPSHPLEQLAPFNIGISTYLAVSSKLKEKLEKQLPPSAKVIVSRNLIDSNLFFSNHYVHSIPKKALIISAYLPLEKESIIRQACQNLHISCKFVGGRFGVVSQSKLHREINAVDIVFSLGRGAIEAMFCQRVPIIFDYLGGDGLVTPNSFDELATENFSGRIHSYQYNVESLINEIKKYRSHYGLQLQKLSHAYYDAKTNIRKLITIYEQVINSKIPIILSSNDKKLCEFFVMSITQTRNFSRLEINQKMSRKFPFNIIRKIKK